MGAKEIINRLYAYKDESNDKRLNDFIDDVIKLIVDLISESKGVRCKDCKHFHYDKPYIIQGIPVLGHEVCDFWGDGCKTNPNGFCSYGDMSIG